MTEAAQGELELNRLLGIKTIYQDTNFMENVIRKVHNQKDFPTPKIKVGRRNLIDNLVLQ